MCVRVSVIDVLSVAAVWDPDDLTILVRRAAHPADAMREVRAILTDLDAPPPVLRGVLCFCGDPILLPVQLAEPRRHRKIDPSATRQVLRGA